jgi:hypothetical protein
MDDELANTSAMHDELADKLSCEFAANTPEVWERILVGIRARRIAEELLASLERPPGSHTRLGRELRLRIPSSAVRREAA